MQGKGRRRRMGWMTASLVVAISHPMPRGCVAFPIPTVQANADREGPGERTQMTSMTGMMSRVWWIGFFLSLLSVSVLRQFGLEDSGDRRIDGRVFNLPPSHDSHLSSAQLGSVRVHLR